MPIKYLLSDPNGKDVRLNTYARLPQTAAVNGIEYCVWEGIEPRHAGEAKGLGLFATGQLPKGYCIPYGGVWRPEAERVTVTHQTSGSILPPGKRVLPEVPKTLPGRKECKEEDRIGGLGHSPYSGLSTGPAVFLLARRAGQQQKSRRAEELRSGIQVSDSRAGSRVFAL